MAALTKFEKSKRLWIGGAVGGAALGSVFGDRQKKAKSALAGALLGAILIGAIGDAYLDRDEP